MEIADEYKILSPVYGQVSKSITDSSVQIHIGLHDVHIVYAPISGIVTAINADNGVLTEEHERIVFEVPEPKVGKAWIEVQGEAVDTVKFWLEVGKPTYSTNRVELYVKTGDRVKAGQQIGEIILGSLAMVFLPEASIPTVSYDSTTRKGSVLTGGVTVIAYMPPWE